MGTSLFNLSGTTALITGSSGGLGFAMARGLGEAGARVILNGRNREKLESAVQDLRAAGIEALGYVFDVTKTAEIASRADEVFREAGPVNILINNAGIQMRMPLETMTEEAWKAVIDTDLTSAFLVTRQFVGRMIERRKGKIINICSFLSEIHRPGIANYTTAKAGLKMLTQAMAVEWAKYNIQANGIGPGYFRTEMTKPLSDNPEFDAWVRRRVPAGRWGDPGDLVGTAVYLSSAASDFVNGQVIYVDGGLLSSV